MLIPWLIAPPSLATESLKLLEILVERHPHQEGLIISWTSMLRKELVSKRLGGLHAFMPLLQLPWPQQEPLESLSLELEAKNQS